ncbi:unnamed protein product [Pleuronectes platessa]|uniref:Uncharacterized protein n=1 Tax=Pleuronectes platessa TaxID=8262 RepID=A0A9N7USR0_PLEPL|nr:unnamed protein product [Pleuronectes platessa]
MNSVLMPEAVTSRRRSLKVEVVLFYWWLLEVEVSSAGISDVEEMEGRAEEGRAEEGRAEEGRAEEGRGAEDDEGEALDVMMERRDTVGGRVD